MRNLEELYDATQVVATQFFTYILINLQKKSKIAKNNEKPKKIAFWYICIFFSNIKIFWVDVEPTQVIVESTLILLKKYKYIKMQFFLGFSLFFAIFDFFCKFIKI